MGRPSPRLPIYSPHHAYHVVVATRHRVPTPSDDAIAPVVFEPIREHAGTLWQRGFYDRALSDPAAVAPPFAYLRRNVSAAGLEAHPRNDIIRAAGSRSAA